METTTTETLINQTTDRFWEIIPPISAQIRGRIRAIAADNFGITFEQFHILRHVAHGVTSVSELAEAKQISRPAISQAVDLLVERGMLTRQQSTDDRRYFSLALTSSGGAVLDEVSRQNLEWMKGKFSHLNAEELTAVLRGLETLQKAFRDQ